MLYRLLDQMACNIRGTASETTTLRFRSSVQKARHHKRTSPAVEQLARHTGHSNLSVIVAAIARSTFLWKEHRISTTPLDGFLKGYDGLDVKRVE